MVMSHIHTKTQIQTSIGLKDRVKTNGQTDGRTDGRRLLIALPYRLTQSVKIQPDSHNSNPAVILQDFPHPVADPATYTNGNSATLLKNYTAFWQ